MIFLVENLRVIKLWFLKDLEPWFLLKSINHTILVLNFMSEICRENMQLKWSQELHINMSYFNN